MTTNCSNNYGPYQFPEKLIPLIIHNALQGKNLPVYGDGRQVRDWLFVEDHCSAIHQVLAAGRIGESYNLGGNSEKQNIDVVHAICNILDSERPRADGRSYAEQITFVKDRPGHDRRYADRFKQGNARARMGAARDVRKRHSQNRALVPRQSGVGRRRHERRIS